MKIKHTLLTNAGFSLENQIFYQRSLQRPGKFEEVYRLIRNAEDRLYNDDIVRMLPHIPPSHPSGKEWMIRKVMMKKLVNYIAKKCEGRQVAILEIGCGNGWLSNQMASIHRAEVLGVDVNETELRQAARVFHERGNLCFAYCDVLFPQILPLVFDYIVLAATIPYFGNLEKLFYRLGPLLADEGEIHVLDSPIYDQRDVPNMQRRSQMHFRKHNSTLGDFYFHHSWDELSRNQYDLLYDPRTIKNRLLTFFNRASPFPWLRIRLHSQVT